MEYAADYPDNLKSVMSSLGAENDYPENLRKVMGSSSYFNKDVTPDRVRQLMPQLREQIAFYREYPDIFVDTIKGKDCTFKFLFIPKNILACGDAS